MDSPRTKLNPNKLRLGKWTAVKPVDKEKHFVVIRVVEPEVEGAPVEFVEIEAVYSGRVRRLHWRDLTDTTRWRQGWL